MTEGLEIWGGIECSIVQTAQSVRNQLHDTGHFSRREDLGLVKELGLKTIRYPVLWEMVEKERDIFDWSWTDKRLGDLQRDRILPIAGLIHHGSGPQWTNMLDPDLPERLAHYAGQVARRYPWIKLFTPVNEPFTTARLSALYGLWHPFTNDEKVCFRITVAECRAISLSMKAIRQVTPDAKLIQTEDFGRIFSTPSLKYQADYENERRWLSIDLLMGRVGKCHPLYKRLLAAGVNPAHLDELQADPCFPDIIGIDYYLTSDRVLDDRLNLHAEEQPGGNGKHSYVDIAAVRSDIPQENKGLSNRLAELWARYGRPIAITELHNGCSREEQLRWFMEGWHSAAAAREGGIDIRAVTSWSLFGAEDWNSMMTRQDNHYESGAFDARYQPPEPTIIAEAIRSLVLSGEFDHPVLDQSGWWHADDMNTEPARPLVLEGFSRISSALEEHCNLRRLRTVLATANEDRSSLFDRHRAWGLVRCGEYRSSTGRLDKTQPMTLTCEYSDGGTLKLDLPPQSNYRDYLDTFLDLIVDHRIGELRCVRPSRSTASNALVEPTRNLENQARVRRTA